MENWVEYEQLFHLDESIASQSDEDAEFVSLIKNCTINYRSFVELNRNNAQFGEALRNFNLGIYRNYCSLRTSVLTSVASESSFSIARKTNHYSRSSLDIKTFTALVCLKANVRY